jgi:hypothetical protein
VPTASGACQHLWLLLFCRCFNESSHVLAMPQTLAPIHLDAGRSEFASRLTQQPCGCGYVVRGLLDGSLPNRLTSQGTADGTAGPVA